jgi:hypothetical protein
MFEKNSFIINIEFLYGLILVTYEIQINYKNQKYDFDPKINNKSYSNRLKIIFGS